HDRGARLGLSRPARVLAARGSSLSAGDQHVARDRRPCYAEVTPRECRRQVAASASWALHAGMVGRFAGVEAELPRTENRDREDFSSLRRRDRFANAASYYNSSVASSLERLIGSFVEWHRVCPTLR